MAFLTKQQTLIEWAELVSQAQLTKLNKIQQPQFTALILSRLDPEYFQPIIRMHEQGVTLSLLFSQIINYYSKQIGTNIANMIDQNINIFSSSSVELIWDLILGIAIKGRNRQKNINTILKMRPQAQEDLMRIISKVINRLGQSVSIIQGSSSQIDPVANNISSNQTDIIMQLTELNQQLKQKVELLSEQINMLKQKNTNIKLQLEQCQKQKKQIINILTKQSISSKSSFISYSSGNTSQYPIVQYIKDIISQFHHLTKQLAKKQQKQLYYEDVNKDLKIAYNAIFNQLQNMHDQTSQKKVDIKKYQREIQQLRVQNQQLTQRQKDLITKISDLQEQKFYLKDIIQRLQTKNALTQQKLQKALEQNKIRISKKSQSSEESKQQKKEKQRQTHRRLLAMRESDSFIGQIQQKKTQKPIQKQTERQKTVRLQLDETSQPSLRNKLQRQVSHLQKKLNSVQQQNTSLKKINSILQKVISDFTKESNQILQKYQSQMQPIFKLFQQTLQQQRQKRKNVQQNNNIQKDEYEQKVKEMLQKIKQKIEIYDGRQIEYQRIIKKLQIERDQLMKTIKVFQDQKTVQETPHIILQRPKKTLSSNKFQLTIPASNTQKQQNKKQQEQQSKHKHVVTQQQINKQKIFEQVHQEIIQQGTQQKQQEKKEEEIYPEIKIQNQKNQLVQQAQLFVEIENKRKISGGFLAASIVNQDQQEPNFRASRYSFMGNKQSTIQFGNEQLKFKEKAQYNKLSSLGSFIREEKSIIGEVNQQQAPVQVFSHVQIIDITQIEQQLVKIKQHYIEITTQSQSFVQKLLTNNNNKQKNLPEINNSNMQEIVKKCQQLGQKQILKTQIKEQEYLKQFQQAGLDRSKLTQQNLKLKNQNKILKGHVNQLSKERQAIIQRLNYLHELSSKNQEDRTKEQLNKLGNAINQINNLMLSTQNNFVQMQDYISKALGEGDKLVGTLSAQIQQLKYALKQRQHAVAQLEMESSLLMGAVLQFRNSAIKTC